MEEEDEWLDLVDADDRVIGQKLRSEVYRDDLHNYRAVGLFILNAKGQLWIPRRTADKRIYPLGLDFSCAGHVGSGETYREALRREAKEELNIDLSRLEVAFVGKMTPEDGVCFIEVYETRLDSAPSYNPDDFVGYEWLGPEELLRRIGQGDYAKRSLVTAVRRFYLAERRE